MNARPQHGSVLVSTLLIAAVLFLAGLAVASRLTGEVTRSRGAVDFDRAWHAAMAGLEECLGYLRWDPAGQDGLAHGDPGSEVCRKSYSGAGFSYTATAILGSPRQVALSSAGTAGGVTRTLGAIAQASLTGGQGFQAWGGGSMRFDGGGTIDGIIYGARDIEVNGTFDVCGNIFAHGTASRGNNVSDLPDCNVGFYSSYPWVAFPDFQVAALKARATTVIDGDYAPECSPSDTSRAADCDGPVTGEQIVWVKGKLTFKSYKKKGKGSDHKDGLYYTGRVIYIADGGVDVNANLTRGPAAMLQIVADGTGQAITVQPGNTVEGIFVNPNGTFSTPGNIALRGLVFAAEWNNNGTLTWIADPLSGLCSGSGCAGARMALVKLWEES